MILLFAVASGFAFGLGWVRWLGQPYQPPALKHLWLVFVSFLPQFIAIYFPNTRAQISDEWASGILIASLIGLLGFAWLNRNLLGMKILFVGAVLNFTVIVANRGFMPISPQTASHLVSEEIVSEIPIGSRFGTKDILLLPEQTRFEILADRFLTPTWLNYPVAFSLGDVFLAIGIFLLLAIQTKKERDVP
ncbi:MAG TPA: hypothetical protein DHW49_13870 [Anaerolineae bacterium]|nr:hypothetical protein [Anaerolineae bacterium]